MLLSLKSFSGHIGCLEMMLCVREDFENMQFPCGDAPALPPAVSHRPIPALTIEQHASHLLYIQGQEIEGSSCVCDRRESPGGPAWG